jgi:hypothetical protein
MKINNGEFIHGRILGRQSEDFYNYFNDNVVIIKFEHIKISRLAI